MMHHRLYRFVAFFTTCLLCTACENDTSPNMPTEDNDFCLENFCLNEDVLRICENGHFQNVSCADQNKICENGECIEPCSKNSCKDNTTLNFCENGKLTEISCSDKNKICENGECIEPCSENSCKDNTTLNFCENGKLTEISCADQNKICENGECIEPCSENSCKDNTTLNFCENGKLTEISCADQNKICENGECIPPECTTDTCNNDVLYRCQNGKYVVTDCSVPHQVCFDSQCQTPEKCAFSGMAYCDGNILIQCNDTLTLARHDCEADGMVCNSLDKACDYECNAATDSPVCKDGTTLRFCTQENKLKSEGCGYHRICSYGQCIEDPCLSCGSDEICHALECHPKSQEFQTMVGMPCRCEGDDCDIRIYNRTVKSYLTALAIMGGGQYLKWLKNSEYAVIPNYFSPSNQGCEALKTNIPAGMAVGCLRDSVFSISPSQADFLMDTVAELLKMIGKESQFVTEKLPAIAAKLREGVSMTSPNGYCFYGTVDLSAQLSNSSLAKMIFIANAFDREKGLFALFNEGSHQTVMDAANAHPEHKEGPCPAGTSWFSYEITRDKPVIGEFFANLDFCLKTCTTDEECRPGYTCYALAATFPKSGLSMENEPHKKVCFDMRNVEMLKGFRDQLKGQ